MIESIKQMLSALESCEMSDYGRLWIWPETAHETAMKNVREAIKAGCQAIAEAEKQKPVATLVEHHGFVDGIVRFDGVENMEQLPIGTKFYTTQPTSQKPLTDEQIEEKFSKSGGRWNGDQWVIEDADLHPFVRSIESPDLKTLQAVSDEYNAWIKHHAAGHTYDDFLATRSKT